MLPPRKSIGPPIRVCPPPARLAARSKASQPPLLCAAKASGVTGITLSPDGGPRGLHPVPAPARPRDGLLTGGGALEPRLELPIVPHRHPRLVLRHRPDAPEAVREPELGVARGRGQMPQGALLDAGRIAPDLLEAPAPATRVPVERPPGGAADHRTPPSCGTATSRRLFVPSSQSPSTSANGAGRSSMGVCPHCERCQRCASGMSARKRSPTSGGVIRSSSPQIKQRRNPDLPQPLLEIVATRVTRQSQDPQRGGRRRDHPVHVLDPSIGHQCGVEEHLLHLAPHPRAIRTVRHAAREAALEQPGRAGEDQPRHALPVLQGEPQAPRVRPANCPRARRAGCRARPGSGARSGRARPPTPRAARGERRESWARWPDSRRRSRPAPRPSGASVP